MEIFFLGVAGYLLYRAGLLPFKIVPKDPEPPPEEEENPQT